MAGSGPLECWLGAAAIAERTRHGLGLQYQLINVFLRTIRHYPDHRVLAIIQ